LLAEEEWRSLVAEIIGAGISVLERHGSG
jgi:hypothetical protein